MIWLVVEHLVIWWWGLNGMIKEFVKMLTTVHDIAKRVPGTRKQPKATSRNGRRIREAFTAPVMDALIPDVINAYNHSKGGVNNADQVIITAGIIITERF
jgi:hypothetical protein